MFTLEINEDSLTLKFEDKDRGLKIVCCPEDITCLTDGGFDSCPSNGEFYFYKKDTKIVFTCAKYGNGSGGSLEISVDVTPEIAESYERILEEWKTFLQERDEEDSE